MHTHELGSPLTTDNVVVVNWDSADIQGWEKTAASHTNYSHVGLPSGEGWGSEVTEWSQLSLAIND